MKVEDIMTRDPVTCMPDTSMRQAAQWMVEGDCGALPVVDSDGLPVGVITDRDITCRVVAQGRDPAALTVNDAMTPNAATVFGDTTVAQCLELMEAAQVRRMVVLDDDGAVCGMVALADIARSARPEETATLLREVSLGTSSASQTG
ncbi:CBS domain-containing protein [Corallococcus sp. H22C18031201]|uniref:CBS domain-containing protein n=1 Tax=Citreicoccus inhibens TaxID=2849499 RepID=UPI000E7690CF|nr:CBS domain-containing protein [Citreicoccus inhibens]MBU8895484.1 CBS domain-containing protein [Citreicoccus inhibens]RJS22486.1 CBS domain-containing protein [Corallococcus sp. H22C18031201]